jgi:hypothetical protein
MNGNSFEMERLLLDNQVDIALVENHSSQAGIRYRDFLDDELIVVTVRTVFTQNVPPLARRIFLNCQ